MELFIEVDFLNSTAVVMLEFAVIRNWRHSSLIVWSRDATWM